MIAQVAVTCFDRLIPCKTEGIEQCDPLGISERGQAALLDERHADGRADGGKGRKVCLQQLRRLNE